MLLSMAGPILTLVSFVQTLQIDQPALPNSLLSRDGGDITFALPIDLAKSVKSVLDNDTSCPIIGSDGSLKAKRIPDDIISCLVSSAENIIDRLGLGNPLASLFDQVQNGVIAVPAQPPAFADDGTSEAMSLVLAYAADFLPTTRPGITSDQIVKHAIAAFAIVISFVFNNRDLLILIVIQHQMLSASSPPRSCIANWKARCESPLCIGKGNVCTGSYFTGCACDPNPCPIDEEEALVCSADCGGEETPGVCLGDKDGFWAGCACLESDIWPPYNAVEHEYHDITDILSRLPNSDPTTCNASVGDVWTSSPAAIDSVNQFCSDPQNLSGQIGDLKQVQNNIGNQNDMTIRATLRDTVSENVVISQNDCVSNLQNILNCPMTNSNVYGGQTLMPSGTLFEIIPNGGHPSITCDPVDPPPFSSGSPSSYKVALNRDAMLKAANDFCNIYKGQSFDNFYVHYTYAPNGVDAGTNLDHQNIMIGAGAAYTENVPENCQKWDKLLNEETCNNVYSLLTDGCDTNTVTGKRGGSSIFECVKWEIGGYRSTADIYRLHIHQQMVDTFSSIEWTLFDSRGITVGGPSTDGTVTGAPQNLGLKVDSPTNKDKTNIRMFYPQGGKFQFSTGWTGSAGSSNYKFEYYCDDVLGGGSAGWVSWQRDGRNGFERQFDCFFRGWGNNDGSVVY